MSGVDLKLEDGQLSEATEAETDDRELYDEEDEDFQRDSWEDIIFMQIGHYSIEYDPFTKELTVTGGLVTDIDCIDEEVTIKEVPLCKTVVFRSPQS